MSCWLGRTPARVRVPTVRSQVRVVPKGVSLGFIQNTWDHVATCAPFTTAISIPPLRAAHIPDGLLRDGQGLRAPRSKDMFLKASAKRTSSSHAHCHSPLTPHLRRNLPTWRRPVGVSARGRARGEQSV